MSQVKYNSLGQGVEQSYTNLPFVGFSDLSQRRVSLEEAQSLYELGDAVITSTQRFDTLGQLQWQRVGGNSERQTTVSYSAPGDTTVTDPEGQVQRSIVDGLGRTRRIEFGTGRFEQSVTEYFYNVAGMSVIRPLESGQETQFYYDPMGRQRAMLQGSGSEAVFGNLSLFNALGELLEYVEQPGELVWDDGSAPAGPSVKARLMAACAAS